MPRRQRAAPRKRSGCCAGPWTCRRPPGPRRRTGPRSCSGSAPSPNGPGRRKPSSARSTGCWNGWTPPLIRCGSVDLLVRRMWLRQDTGREFAAAERHQPGPAAGVPSSGKPAVRPGDGRDGQSRDLAWPAVRAARAVEAVALPGPAAVRRRCPTRSPPRSRPGSWIPGPGPMTVTRSRTAGSLSRRRRRPGTTTPSSTRRSGPPRPTMASSSAATGSRSSGRDARSSCPWAGRMPTSPGWLRLRRKPCCSWANGRPASSVSGSRLAPRPGPAAALPAGWLPPGWRPGRAGGQKRQAI